MAGIGYRKACELGRIQARLNNLGASPETLKALHLESMTITQAQAIESVVEQVLQRNEIRPPR